MSPEKLAYMANQIGKFFASQGEEKAAAAVVDHLLKFWDPRMRSEISAFASGGGAGLDPVVRRAIERLQEADARKP